MFSKLIKAYKTAWRWPVTTNDPSTVVWSSRILAYIAPVMITAACFAIGLLTLGLAGAVLVTLIVGMGLVVLTVTIFHPEYPDIREYEKHEDRIARFFTGFPQYTNMPIMENGDNEWVAYGHIDPTKFLSAVQTIIKNVSEDDKDDLSWRYVGLEPFVSHDYAKFTNQDENYWDEGIDLCVNSLDRCFPITRITLS
jgi:hypothetical protein